jgi:hypothetical protein
VTGVGCIPVRMRANNVWQPAVLQDVLYVPALHRNLLSVSQLAHHSAEMRFKGEGCQILDQHKDLTCEGELHGNLYVMGIEATHPETARIAIINEFPDKGGDLPEHALAARGHMSKASLDTCHRCLGHLHQDAILSMQKIGMVKGMDITRGKALTTPCKPCLQGKQTHAEIQKTTDNRTDAVLGQIYSNVCRKLPTKSHQGYEYFITWIDNKSHKVFIMGLHEKSNVFKHLKALVPQVELQTGEHVKLLRMDGGGKYTGNEVKQFLQDRGISHEITTLDTPQHNGMAKWMNWTLLIKVRALLTDMGLPESYWYDALSYAAYIHNVSPTCALNNIMPEEAWSRNKPDVSRLCVFGS